MSNNILLICPSWEYRSFWGFKQDNKDLEINKVVAIKKKFPVNETEISDCIKKRFLKIDVPNELDHISRFK